MDTQAIGSSRLAWLAIFLFCLYLALFAVVPPLEAQASPLYVADFVSTAATGTAMNDTGDVVGTSYQDIGCGSTCLPPIDTVVWKGGQRIVLPALPGLTGVTVVGMNSSGWVAGYAGLLGTTTHAVAWKPVGNTYQIFDLGVLPATDYSTAAGIDDLGRVVGYSITKNFPPTGAPFVWTETSGLVDLAGLGFPNETPLGVSAGGSVALSNSWYSLDDPASVVNLAQVPQGFYPPGSGAVAINDAGDQVRFLTSTSTQNLVYLFRYHHEGVWKQIGFTGNGQLSPFGVGGIDALQNAVATDHGSGVFALGPDGVGQSLSTLLAASYGTGGVIGATSINGSGQVLARVLIGNSPRVMRLTPAQACTVNCIRVTRLVIRGKFIPDPNDPGQCTPNAKNHVEVTLQITNEAGRKLAGIAVSGRFLDDYWANTPASATTDQKGTVKFVNDGLACVGAVAFLVDDASKGARRLDRTFGTLTGSVIPLL